MRAFIAIDLDPDIKSALGALVRDLESARAEIRWVRSEGMHLTLKFLGEIDGDQAERVKAVLSEVAGRRSPFPLRLEGTGVFPGERDPRVLWVGFAVQPELLSLAEELDAALDKEGFEREKRPFKPHLTIGRVKGPGRLGKAMDELAKHREESFGSMAVGKILLFESRLRPEGAEYRILFEAGLA